MKTTLNLYSLTLLELVIWNYEINHTNYTDESFEVQSKFISYYTLNWYRFHQYELNTFTKNKEWIRILIESIITLPIHKT